MPPFHGVSVTGYDNATQEVRRPPGSTHMTTASPTMTGEMDAAGKVLTFHYEEFDPMTGKIAKARQVIPHRPGRDSHEWSSTRVMADGKETKVGEIKYTRKK